MRDHFFIFSNGILSLILWRGEEQGNKSPFFLLSEPISPSSLNVYLTFSPSSLLSPPISPSSQLFSGHFSLLPILFLPPLCLVLQLLNSFNFKSNAKLHVLGVSVLLPTYLNNYDKPMISHAKHT